MMKIAHIVPTFPKISETFILNQIIGLQNRGHDNDIYALRNSGESIEHEVIEENELTKKTRYANCPINKVNRILKSPLPLIKVLKNKPGLAVESFNFHKYGKPSYNLENIYRASTFAPNLDEYSVLHAHFGQVGNVTRLWSNYSGTPLVVSFYGHDAYQDLENNPDKFRDLFDEAERIIVLSEDMRRTLEENGCPPNKISKTPLCVDTDRFEFSPRTIDDGPIKILSVARLVEKKGLYYAIKAVSEISEEYDVQYRIAGDGPLREDLERIIQEKGLEDKIEILGWKTQGEVRELIYNSHIFILPSITASNGDKEGTPTAILEAESTGMPIISSRHSGIPEIVKDGESGFLVPEKDVNKLIEVLEETIAMKDSWNSMGETGREVVNSTHSIDAVSQNLEETYKEVIQRDIHL